LPQKEGRKKAAERLKYYERSINELDKRRFGIEAILGVSKEKVSICH
jgi:hypothetical protein